MLETFQDFLGLALKDPVLRELQVLVEYAQESGITLSQVRQAYSQEVALLQEGASEPPVVPQVEQVLEPLV